MSDNGKGSARRGTSKEEMKRFEDNYDDIFRKPHKKVVVESIEVIEMSPEHLKLAEELMDAIKKQRILEDSETTKKS